MVQMYFDRKYRKRTYPKTPIKTRLQNWLNRLAMRTSKFKKPLRLQIRQKYAQELGLPDAWVTLLPNGSLVHDSCAEPLARAATA